MGDPVSFLDDIAGFIQAQQNRPDQRPHHVRLATIDSGYNPDSFPTVLPRVTFDGESVLSGRFYPVLSPYRPRPSDRVAMVTSGHTYIILGKLADQFDVGRIPGQWVGGVESGTDSSPFTTDEVVVLSAPVAVFAGRTYSVVGQARFGGDATPNSNVLVRLREDDEDGDELQLGQLEIPNNSTAGYGPAVLIGKYVASVTETKTFVMTGMRNGANGNLRREAGTNSPSTIDVYYRSG